MVVHRAKSTVKRHRSTSYRDNPFCIHKLIFRHIDTHVHPSSYMHIQTLTYIPYPDMHTDIQSIIVHIQVDTYHTAPCRSNLTSLCRVFLPVLGSIIGGEEEEAVQGAVGLAMWHVHTIRRDTAGGLQVAKKLLPPVPTHSQETLTERIAIGIPLEESKEHEGGKKNEQEKERGMVEEDHRHEGERERERRKTRDKHHSLRRTRMCRYLSFP